MRVVELLLVDLSDGQVELDCGFGRDGLQCGHVPCAFLCLSRRNVLWIVAVDGTFECVDGVLLDFCVLCALVLLSFDLRLFSDRTV